MKLLQTLKLVAVGNNTGMTTFCPNCPASVPVRNEKAVQYAKDGILCDKCRSKNLSQF